MSKRKEPAEQFLTIKPAQKFNIQNDGFIGSLYKPQDNSFEGKVLIMSGGSDGYFSLTCLIAEQFVKRGLTVLALAYWNQPGLPDAFEKIPVEYVERAALWLKNHNYIKIGMWGISKGSEYALISGSILQNLISCVVAVCPINICGQGIRKGKSIRLLDCSAWSFRGKEIPYANLQYNKRQIIKDMLKRRSICKRSCYNNAIVSAPENAYIQIENINGPILFLSANDDDMWPAKEASEWMMERLNRKQFPYQHKHYNYEYASHFLIPYKLKSVKMFAVERRYPEECMESNRKSLEDTLIFLNEW